MIKWNKDVVGVLRVLILINKAHWELLHNRYNFQSLDFSKFCNNWEIIEGIKAGNFLQAKREDIDIREC